MGYYARGERKDVAKPTPAASQARAYVTNALLSGLLMRAEAATARVALAFPDGPTFNNSHGELLGHSPARRSRSGSSTRLVR